MHEPGNLGLIKLVVFARPDLLTEPLPPLLATTRCRRTIARRS
jgi:hypothetical protein